MRTFAFNVLAFLLNVIHWTSIGCYVVFLKEGQKEYAAIGFIIACLITCLCHNNFVEAMKRLDEGKY